MQNLSESLPTTFYELMSTPIWHNRFLGTKFNCELSGIGFNFVRDIVSEGKIMTKDHFSIQNLKYSNKSGTCARSGAPDNQHPRCHGGGR